MTCRIRDPPAEIYLTYSSCIAYPLSDAVALIEKHWIANTVMTVSDIRESTPLSIMHPWIHPSIF